MAVTSGNNSIKDRDKFYFRQRNKNRVFEKIISQFAEEAERHGITKKYLAERLKSDPAQITRWLSAPGNLTLDSISDILLALDAEMDYAVTKFKDRAKPNYIHPLMRSVVLGPTAATSSTNTSVSVAFGGEPSETFASSPAYSVSFVSGDDYV